MLRSISRISGKKSLWNSSNSNSFQTKKRYAAATTFLTPKINLPHSSSGGGRQTKSTFPATLREEELEASAVAEPLFVPSCITRPDYADSEGGIPKSSNVYGEVKTEEAIEKMRDAGKLAAEALQLAIDSTKIGVSGKEVVSIVHNFIISKGAYPSPLNFHGFPSSLVISVNEACCHGIPNARLFKSGDVVKYDCVVYLNGYHGDCAATVGVGEVSDRHKNLINTCRTARDEAIKLCKPGVPVHKIGECIAAIAMDSGFKVVEEFSGHFIGSAMHMPPLVPHVKNSTEYILTPGNTFTIEPILTEGLPELVGWRDGWTVATKDCGFSAQWEHTVLITENGAEILTKLPKSSNF